MAKNYLLQKPGIKDHVIYIFRFTRYFWSTLPKCFEVLTFNPNTKILMSWERSILKALMAKKTALFEDIPTLNHYFAKKLIFK